MTEQSPRAGMMTLEQTARLLMLSKERVRQLVAEGRLPKADRNQYPLVSVVQDFIRLKEDEVLRVREAASDNGLRSARQREIELRIAVKERELIPTEEADQILAFFVAQLHAAFDVVPRRITTDRDLKRKIEDEIDAAFHRVAEAAERASSQLREGEEAGR